MTTPPADPADEIDPQTGMSPRQAAAIVCGGDDVELSLADPFTAGRYSKGCPDADTQTLKTWHARRATAATAFVAAIREAIDMSNEYSSEPGAHYQAQAMAVESALAAFDAVRAGGEEKTDA